MMLILTYDISSNRRRTRLHKRLLDYGQAVQLSVFEIDENCLEEVLEVCNEEIKAKDHVRIYKLCKRCMTGTRIFGGFTPIQQDGPSSRVIELPIVISPPEIASADRARQKPKRVPTRTIGPMEAGIVLPQSRLMEAVCSMANLNEAFLDVRANRGAAGVDGQSIAAFDRRRNDNLAKLQQELLNDSYRPLPLRVVEIPKKSGGSRTLRIPSVRDRVAQQSVLRIIRARWEREFENSSYAYRKGRSVKQAASAVRRLREQGANWVLRSDIEDYFENIPHEQLLLRFSQVVSDGQLNRLIERWLTSPQAVSKSLGVAVGNGKDRGVPQGSCVSPLLSNVYLDRFDEAVIKAGYHMVRYADDFVIVCKSQEDAVAAKRFIEAELVADGLRLHKDKTFITNFSEGFVFLGYLFVGSFVIKAAQIPTSWRIKGIAKRSMDDE